MSYTVLLASYLDWVCDCDNVSYKRTTPPKTNIFAPEHVWLEDCFPFGLKNLFSERLPVVLGRALTLEFHNIYLFTLVNM